MAKLLHGTTHKEKWWGTLGSVGGIFLTLVVSVFTVGPEVAVPIVTSMGASAVLLFGAPNSPLAQPWNTFGGHFLSALVGVIAAQLLAPVSLPLAGAVAVASAICVMQYFNCIHPPGGATALFAVMGGKKVLSLGFAYIAVPVMLNTTLLLSAAILFGRMSRVRRYPPKRTAMPEPSRGHRPPIAHDNLVHALGRLDTFIDVDERDLLEIYKLATGHHADAMVAEKLSTAGRLKSS